jgi:hypothetical protein
MPKRNGELTKGEKRLARGKVRDPARVTSILEGSFRTWFRRVWFQWMDRIEPTRGSTIGFPDVLVLTDGAQFPIELKIGTIRDGRIFADEVRPAQVIWHRDFERFGGSSLLLIGAPLEKAGHWAAFAVSGTRARYWQDGFVIGKEAYLINGKSDDEFLARMKQFIRDYRAGHFR